jgi:hypothetical protein
MHLLRLAFNPKKEDKPDQKEFNLSQCDILRFSLNVFPHPHHEFCWTVIGRKKSAEKNILFYVWVTCLLSPHIFVRVVVLRGEIYGKASCNIDNFTLLIFLHK